MQILLTRSDAQNNELSTRIASQGIELLSRPLLTTEALPLDQAQKTRVLALDQYDDVFFISQNAVRFGIELLEAYWPQWPAHLRWFAVGSATAQALQEVDVAATYPKRASSEDLLALNELQQITGRSSLIVRGNGGRETLKQGLQGRGEKVDYLEVYQRVEVEYSASDFPHGGRVVALLYSGEAISHLRHCVGLPALAYQLIVPSQRLQIMAKEMGFAKVELANSQEDDAMLEVLNKLLGKYL
jgi:uroporphyrinogen-III synthase